MIEFMRGVWMPLSTTLMPASASTGSNNAGNLPSRSRMRYLALDPASSRSMTRFLAICVTQELFGWAVAPRIRIRRVACSITARTYIRAPLTVTVSRKSQASRASACRRRYPQLGFSLARLLSAQLALQHRDLMSQDEDLSVLVPIAHRR